MTDYGQKLRYQPNKRAYGFVMLGVLLAVIGMFRVINVYYYNITSNPPKTVQPTVWIGISILIDIILILVTFLSAEKVKSYKKNWSFVLFGVAAYMILRNFMFSLNLLQNGHITVTNYLITFAFFLAAAALYVWAGIDNRKKSLLLEKHLETVK